MKEDHKQFDVIVIGAGSGGLNIAGFVNKVGLQVLLIDKEDRSIGGDCLNFGCVPSKALIRVARLIKDAGKIDRFGLSVQGKVDIKKVIEYISDKKEFIRQHENASYFRNQGMTVVLGRASFVDRETVEVAGNRYRGKKIIIATGSRPRQLDIPGIQAAETLNNENVFSLDNLPEKMVVVGAGPIGVEIGQAMSILGTKVTIVGPRFLDKEDPEISGILEDVLRKDGIELYLGYRPMEIKNGKTLVVVSEQDKIQEIQFDKLFVSIGRELNIDELNVKKAGIKTDEKGRLVLDEYLQTTNKNIIACGDVAGGHMFTHAAELHASVIINNLFSPFKKKLNSDAMAWVTYTSPEIATFGLDEKQLKKKKIAYETIVSDFADTDRAIVDGYETGKLKLLISKRGILLGGSLVAPNAGELAQELMLAQANKMNVKSFMKKVYPYPTATRINRKAVLAYMSKKLTSRSKKILGSLFNIFSI